MTDRYVLEDYWEAVRDVAQFGVSVDPVPRPYPRFEPDWAAVRGLPEVVFYLQGTAPDNLGIAALYVTGSELVSHTVGADPWKHWITRFGWPIFGKVKPFKDTLSVGETQVLRSPEEVIKVYCERMTDAEWDIENHIEELQDEIVRLQNEEHAQMERLAQVKAQSRPALEDFNDDGQGDTERSRQGSQRDPHDAR